MRKSIATFLFIPECVEFLIGLGFSRGFLCSRVFSGFSLVSGISLFASGIHSLIFMSFEWVKFLFRSQGFLLSLEREVLG